MRRCPTQGSVCGDGERIPQGGRARAPKSGDTPAQTAMEGKTQFSRSHHRSRCLPEIEDAIATTRSFPGVQ
jgi:hypothetical protein